MQPHSIGRKIFAILAFLLSIIAMTVELWLGVCQDSFFDPLPDDAAIIAYGFLALMPLWNEFALSNWSAGMRKQLGDMNVLGITGAGSAIALVIAIAYTIMFIPLLPISILALALFGIGVCAWSPLFNLLVLSFQIKAIFKEVSLYQGPEKRIWAISSIGVTAVTFLYFIALPFITGMVIREALSEDKTAESSLGMLRTLHADKPLALLANGQNPGYWVALGTGLWAEPFSPRFFVTEGDNKRMRDIYYLLTGDAFETAPKPPQSRRALFQSATEQSDAEEEASIEETGGQEVGHTIKGLSLASSQLDAELDPAHESMHAVWTMTFQNRTALPQEARTNILLPPGGVVDGVSLWINNVECPAAFGPRGQVRKAYQQVAVVERRDPLLVTASSADRVMAQCFPVPPNGKMKIKLTIAAPLLWKNSAAPRLCFIPPVFDDVNFRLPKSLSHHIFVKGNWVKPLGILEGASWTISNPASAGNAHEARLDTPSNTHVIPQLSVVQGRIPQTGDQIRPDLVRKESPFVSGSKPVDVIVLVDTTAHMDDALDDAEMRSLRDALVTLPTGSRVRFADTRRIAAATPWIPAENPQTLQEWRNSLSFHGGMDSMPALLSFCTASSDGPNPRIIFWLHDPKPVSVADTDKLEQLYETQDNLPCLIGIQYGVGKDSVMDHLAHCRRIHALNGTLRNDSFADAAHIASLDASAMRIINTSGSAPLGGRQPAINGTYAVSQGQTAALPDALSVNSEVLATWYGKNKTADELRQATQKGIRNHIVTPFSGAVVLETQQQYNDNELNPPNPAVPSVPEPSTIAAFCVGVLILAIKIYRKRTSALS